MPENRHLRFLLRLLYAALALAGLWLCVRFLLPWLLPFLLAWGLAALLEPAVGLLMRRLRLPRWGAAALCTAALAAALLGLLALALWRAWYELTRLVARLPVLLSGLPALAEELEGGAYRFLVALPLPLQDAAREGLENLARQGAALPGRLSQALAEGAAGLAAALPSAALFLFSTLLAAFFTRAGPPSPRKKAWGISRGPRPCCPPGSRRTMLLENLRCSSPPLPVPIGRFSPVPGGICASA